MAEARGISEISMKKQKTDNLDAAVEGSSIAPADSGCSATARSGRWDAFTAEELQTILGACVLATATLVNCMETSLIRRPMMCSRCEINHHSGEEKQEVHEATDRIHAWLKERTIVVMNAEPVKPGAILIRPPKLAKVPIARLEVHMEEHDDV